MATDAIGNVYVVGTYEGTMDLDPGPGVTSVGPAYGSDIWFGKYSSNGTLIWAHALYGGNDDAGMDIAVDNSNNVYITGFYSLPGAPAIDFNPGAGTASATVAHGFFFAKYNTSGTFQWLKTIGNPTDNVLAMATAIAVDGSGNCYVTGRISKSGGTANVNFNPSGSSLLNTANGSTFFAKYNTSGAYQWAKNTAGTASISNDIALDGSNNVYVTGSFYGSSIDFNAGAGTSNLTSTSGGAFITKYNSSGSFTWGKQVSGQDGDYGKGCVIDASGNVYVTGVYNTNGYNAFLAKFNSSGTQQLFKSIGGSSMDQGQSLKLDNSGNLFMAGYFRGTNVDFNPGGSSQPLSSAVSFNDFFLAKYSTSTLNCQWARQFDMQLGTTNNEVSGLAFSNAKLVAAGSFYGTGDFNACASSTLLSAANLDGFIAGFEPSTQPLNISGPVFTCNPIDGPTTYTVTNAPLGATVNWSITPAGLVTPTSGTGNSIVITPTGLSGNVTISATVAGTCSNTGSRSIWVGQPIITYDPPGPGNPCHNSPYYYTNIPNADYYSWSVDNPNVWIISGSNSLSLSVISINAEVFNLTLTITSGNCSYTITLPNEISPAMYCDCFYDPGQCPEQEGGGGMGLRVSPNPSSDYFDVIVPDLVKDKEKGDGTVQYKIKVTDQFGQVVFTETTSSKAFRLNTQSFKNGIYFIHVTSKDKSEWVRVLIEGH